ncbi:MAG TPA: phytoene/squalene synthase family protein [Isosphaeraceae bacterium]|nr:phytoene/squalene synthase family protein [Isosphaeraceae bacterium]
MNASLSASYRFCGQVSRREARNFYYSFLVLPPSRRRSMCALYAFLRHTDDLADGPGSAEEKGAVLDAWRRDLNAALGGEHVEWPGLPALADTVDRHSIPHQHLHEVIEGVCMDVRPRPYPTFADLYTYCYRVASAVGLSCIHIWGYRSEGGRAEALAEACGIALQLTNILRDVREDAQAGRIYLPQEDLERFGVSADDLAAPRPNDRVRELFAFEGRRAYDYYRLAGPLAKLVEPVGRPVLGAIVGIYRALLDEIARRDYDVLAARVALPAWRKTAITLRALTWWFERPEPIGV